MRRFGFIICLGLLLASLGANIVFIKTSIRLFKKLQLSRIYPVGYIRNDTAPDINASTARSTREKLLFLGDSRIEMWDRSAFSANKYIVKNIGHGGQTSAQVLMQLQTEMIPEFDWAIVQVGINDIHPLGAFAGLKRDILRNLNSNIADITKILTADNGKVILTTIFPPSKPPLNRRLFWDEKTRDIIKQVNLFLKETEIRGETVFVVDAHRLLADDTGWLDTRYRDSDFFLHVNPSAYTMLNQEIIGRIESGIK